MQVGILIGLQQDIYERIGRMARLGFDNGQLSAWDMSLYNAQTARQVRDACADFGFAVTALWCGWSGPTVFRYPDMYATIGLMPTAWRGLRTRELLDGAAFARAIGVQDIVTHLGYLPDNPFDADRMGVVQSVRYICREIGQYGQRFLFETGEELPVTLVQVMQEAGEKNLGVNFDPANLLINGRANPLDALDLLGPYIGGVHAKDGVYPQGVNPKGREVKIGEGAANFPLLIEKLVRLGYDGAITIERETPEGEQRDQEILEEKASLEEMIRKVETE